MSTADAVGILFLIVIWVAFVTLVGVWVGHLITRRRNRR